MSRSGIMLCYPFEEKRLAKWSPPYVVQPKLDGERCRYKQYEGGSFLLSSQENVIFGAPHIKHYLDSVCPTGLHLDGELYCHGKYRDWETDRKSTRLNSSHSAKSRMPSSA